MFSEQRIRVFLFYLSLAVFLMGLPLILSSTLGYKFNPRTFKFAKAGLIVLKTQPSGASVYLDNKLLNLETPATINELLPRRYHLRVELEGYYPWSDEIEIAAGKVTRLEKIILFPLRPDIKKLNKDKFSYFLTDEEKQAIYYVGADDDSIYKSDLEGEHFEWVANFVKIIPPPAQWKLSADRKKLLYFNVNQIGVAYLEPRNEMLPLEPSFILSYANGRIIDVFWHSDSYHFVLISNRNIEVLEAQATAEPLVLVTLNKKHTHAYYDLRTDTLYFLDSQAAPDGNVYDNLYKLQLNARAFLSQESKRLKSYE